MNVTIYMLNTKSEPLNLNYLYTHMLSMWLVALTVQASRSTRIECEAQWHAPHAISMYHNRPYSGIDRLWYHTRNSSWDRIVSIQHWILTVEKNKRRPWPLRSSWQPWVRCSLNSVKLPIHIVVQRGQTLSPVPNFESRSLYQWCFQLQGCPKVHHKPRTTSPATLLH